MKSVMNAPNPISVTRAYGINARNPIITRASNQKIGTAQTFGLPGSKENKTVLGAYRMGSSEESSGAIYPGDVFPPMPPASRDYPEVTFQTTGINVYQPEINDSALHSLLKKYGEQKFKASQNEPFAEYFQAQKMAKDIEEASKITGTSDKELGREIIRSISDFRRKQNLDDYQRKLVDAGLPVAQAEEEIANLRKAQALFEAKNVDDRPYQAKMMIHNLARKKGVISAVNEPLTQSGAIANPQMNHSVAAAMGVPQDAFGNQPVDVNRMSVTPDFYRRFLRRSQLTQDFADQQSAINQMIAEGGAEGFAAPPEISAASREKQILDARDSAAAKLDVLRNRHRKNIQKLPPIKLFAEPIFKEIYKVGLADKKSGEETSFKRENIDDMTIVELILALNSSLYLGGERSIIDTKRFLQSVDLGREDKPKDLKPVLRDAVNIAARGKVVSIPAGLGTNGDVILGQTPEQVRKVVYKVLTEARQIIDFSPLDAFNSGPILSSYDSAFSQSLTGRPSVAESNRKLADLMQERGRSLTGGLSEEQAPPSMVIEEMVPVSTRRLKPVIEATSVPMSAMGAKSMGKRDEEFIAATREKFPRGSKPKLVTKSKSAPATPSKPDYSGMTVPELKSAAKTAGKKGYSTLNKSDLLALLAE